MKYFKEIFITGAVLVACVFHLEGTDVSEITFEIPEGSMTVLEAMTIALENNPGIEEVAQRIAHSEGTLKRAKSYLFPTLSVNAGYQGINGTAHADWAPSIRATESFNQLDAGISLRWRLFDGLQDIHYLRAAKKGLESSRQQHINAQRILMEQVSAAMVQSQLAKEGMRISKSHFDFNYILKSDALKRWEVGEIPEADVLNFSLALVQAESGFQSAKQDYEIACTIIAQLLSFGDGALPASKQPTADLGLIDSEVPAYETSFASALQNRPDLRALEAGLTAYEHQVKALKGSFLPSFDLVAGIRYKKQYGIGAMDQDENDNNIGLQGNWTLFNGGRKKARVLEMRADKQALFHQYEQLLDSIASDVRQNIIVMESSVIIYHKQKEAESYARKIRDYVEKAYQAGSASITRLNEAQNYWIQSSSALSAAKLQILLNQYGLKATTGEILSES